MHCPECNSAYTEQLTGMGGAWSCGCGYVWEELPNTPDTVNGHLLLNHDEEPCSRCKGEGCVPVTTRCGDDIYVRCSRCQGKGVVHCQCCHFCGRMGDPRHDFQNKCDRNIENAEPLELVLFCREGAWPIIPTGKVRWAE